MTPSAARAMAPLPKGVMVTNKVGSKGGDGDDGRRSRRDVGRARQGTTTGRWFGPPTALVSRAAAATATAVRDTMPLPKGVRAANNVSLKGGGGDALPENARAADDVVSSSDEEHAVSCGASSGSVHGSLPRPHRGFGFGPRLGAGRRVGEKMEDEEVNRN